MFRIFVRSVNQGAWTKLCDSVIKQSKVSGRQRAALMQAIAEDSECDALSVKHDTRVRRKGLKAFIKNWKKIQKTTQQLGRIFPMYYFGAQPPFVVPKQAEGSKELLASERESRGIVCTLLGMHEFPKVISLLVAEYAIPNLSCLLSASSFEYACKLIHTVDNADPIVQKLLTQNDTLEHLCAFMRDYNIAVVPVESQEHIRSGSRQFVLHPNILPAKLADLLEYTYRIVLCPKDGHSDIREEGSCTPCSFRDIYRNFASGYKIAALRSCKPGFTGICLSAYSSSRLAPAYKVDYSQSPFDTEW